MLIKKNPITYKWEMEPEIVKKQNSTLPYAALKREYLDFLDDKYELYVYSAIAAYYEYCKGPFTITLEYLSDYYELEIDKLKEIINLLVEKCLISIHNVGNYNFEIAILN